MQYYLDFGGRGPLAHLVTANGFPPEAYAPLAHALRDHLHIYGYYSRPLRPHSDPRSITSWRDLAREMLDDMASFRQPVVGMGHSLGGIMTMYAALWQPERFSQLILIDPVFMPRGLLAALWLLRKLGQSQRFPLAQGAARRRAHFRTREEAKQRYTGRGVFKDFAEAALDGYLAGGLRPEGEGLTLAWPPAWESRIFALVPIDTWDAVRRLRVPTTIIRGTRSDLLFDRSWRDLQRTAPHITFVELEGGHMIPLEHPEAVADVVRMVAEQRSAVSFQRSA